MPVSSFRDLVCWQRAQQLSVLVYHLSRAFPADERWGLVAQMRRASVSVMANIAEGNGRGHRREYCHFLRIAAASAREVQSHILLADALGYTRASESAEALDAAEEVCRMTWAMIRALRRV